MTHKNAILIIGMILFFKGYNYAQTDKPTGTYPFNMDYLIFSASKLAEDDTIIPVYKNSKFHYINSYTGAKLFNSDYDEAYPFNMWFGLVKTNGLYGIIDKKGKYLVKPQFKFFESNGGEIIFSQDATTHGPYFYFYDGKLHSEAGYVEGKPLTSIIHAEKVSNGFQLMVYKRFGEHSKIGEPYDEILNTGYDFAIVKKDGKIGAVDTVNKVIMPFIYSDYMSDSYKLPIYFALKSNDLWYYYNDHKLLFSSEYKPLSYKPFNYEDVVAIYQDKDQQYNYLNIKGLKVLSKNHNWIAPNGIVVANKDKQILLLNKAKKEFLYYQSK